MRELACGGTGAQNVHLQRAAQTVSIGGIALDEPGKTSGRKAWQRKHDDLGGDRCANARGVAGGDDQGIGCLLGKGHDRLALEVPCGVKAYAGRLSGKGEAGRAVFRGNSIGDRAADNPWAQRNGVDHGNAGDMDADNAAGKREG